MQSQKKNTQDQLKQKTIDQHGLTDTLKKILLFLAAAAAAAATAVGRTGTA